MANDADPDPSDVLQEQALGLERVFGERRSAPQADSFETVDQRAGGGVFSRRASRGVPILGRSSPD